MSVDCFNENEEIFKDFAANPCNKTAFALIMASKTEIKKIADGWNSQNLSDSDKIRELICELFLIMLENFKVNVELGYGSFISYVRKRLLRITKERTRSFMDIDGDEFKEPEDSVGRVNLDADKLEQTDIMLESLRDVMLSSEETEAGILYFLFVHVYPSMSWASGYLTAKFGGDSVLRAANDRKKIYRLNLKLRNSLKQNSLFDYKSILNWNLGERNYLAWRLVSIAPSELYKGKSVEKLDVIDSWRDSFKLNEEYSENRFLAAQSVYSSMKENWLHNHKNFIAEEETEIYGKVPDLLGMLIGKPNELSFAAKDRVSTKYGNHSVSDKEFNLIAEELSEWFTNLYSKRVERQ